MCRGLAMFVQIIQGKTSNPEALSAAVDQWTQDLAPGATGWLGSTGGVTEDGRFIAAVRFESAEAARRNSERPLPCNGPAHHAPTRRQVMLLSFLITLDLAPAIPAHADPGDIKTSSSKTSKAPPLDDPAFTHRLGYQGQIYEDRHGVYNLTIHTSGSMVGATHVEGDVTANFTISPLQGTGVVYREHAAVTC